MNVKLERYNGKYRIVSLAFDQSTKEDLLKENIDFIFVTYNNIQIYPEGNIVSEDKYIIDMLHYAHNYDVYELWENGKLLECYNDRSLDNYFFVTAKCNSNCIMCPSPDISRQKGGSVNVDTLIEIAKHIPTDAKHLTITGGEPFMIGKDIFKFIEFISNKFENTEFLFLTNGRIFAVDSYVKKFAEVAPKSSIIAIPVHGSNEIIHDSITQTRGSFEQTINGIKKLLKLRMHIELRIVVSKMNVNDIYNIAKFISNEILGIEYVSIMAMEMTGSARANQDIVWISYSEVAKAIEAAVMLLIENGIDVKLYNFPLCLVKKKFWTLCEKSISPNKVRYAENCDICKMKKSCGGIFAGTISMEKGELKPII